MSQSDFANLSSPTSGQDLIDTVLEPWRDALHTMHSGSSRPSYAVAGMQWLDTTGTPWLMKMYDGADDITLGSINPTTNVYTPFGIPAPWAGSAGGTANAFTLTPSPAITANAAGVAYDFLVINANTAINPTVNISGVGAVQLRGSIGMGKVNLPIGALQPGMVARIVNDGTHYVLQGMRPYNPATAVATATTVNLDTANGDYVELTGTTTVTGVTLGNGQERTCKAAGAFLLTNGANLILPGGANITTAAGDTFILRGESGSKVRCVAYTRADGLPIAVIDEDNMASNSDTKVPTQQSVKAYVDSVVSPLYESSEVSIGTNTVTTIAHGLTAAPKDYKLYAICKSAEFGYGVGAEMEVTGHHFNGSGNYAGAAIAVDATNVYIIHGNEITTRRMDNGNAVSSITKASWRFIARWKKN